MGIQASFKNEMEEYFVLNDVELYKQRTIIVNDTYYPHSTADDTLFLQARYIELLDEKALYAPDLHSIMQLGSRQFAGREEEGNRTS